METHRRWLLFAEGSRWGACGFREAEEEREGDLDWVIGYWLLVPRQMALGGVAGTDGLEA